MRRLGGGEEVRGCDPADQEEGQLAAVHAAHRERPEQHDAVGWEFEEIKDQSSETKD